MIAIQPRVCLALTAMLLVAAAGCRSGAPGTGRVGAPGTDVPGATTERPPEPKPVEPPSWPAKEYQSDEYGFGLHYPADFEDQPSETGSLLTAASPMQVPRIDVTRIDTPEDASLEAIVAGIETTLANLGSGEAKVTQQREVTLRDEATPAMEMVVEWTFQGFPLQSFILAAVRDTDLIQVMVTGMQGGEIEELSEIAYTLYFES